jgi:hypothetical protein
LPVLLAAAAAWLPIEARAQIFIVNPDNATVPRGGTVAVLDTGQASVLANDFIIFASNPVVQLSRAPKHGELTLNADGTFFYRHDGSGGGSDDFKYIVCELVGGSPGNCSKEAEVKIAVTASAVAPQITGQRTLSTPEDLPLQIRLEDLIVEDPDSRYPQDFSLRLSDGDNYAIDGTTVVPDLDFVGTLTIGTRVNDGQADSNEFPLRVDVPPVNDRPRVVQAIGEQQAVHGEPFVLDLAPFFFDPDAGDSLSYAAAGLPPSGSLQVDPATGRLSGTPEEGDTLNPLYPITVTATDRSGLSVSTAFDLRVLPRSFDLSIVITATPEPATAAAAPLWSLTVTNASVSTSDPAQLHAQWYSTGAPVSLTPQSECTVINDLSFNPQVECEIEPLPPNGSAVIRVQSAQESPGDQTVVVRLTTGDANDGNDAAVKSLNLAGSFNETPAQRLPGPGADLAVADLDGDGAADLAAVSDTVRIYFNTGERTFATTPVSPPGTSTGEALAVLDWNGDDRLDIAVLRRSGSSGRVYLNGGNRTFVAGAGLPPVSAWAVTVIDSNLDGITELAVAGDGGTGLIGPDAVLRVIDARPAGDIVAADLNADGVADLAVVLQDTGNLAVLESAGNGQFTVRTLTGFGSLVGIGAGDVNGDSAPDLLLAVDSADLEIPANVVLRNELNGSFSELLTFGATDTAKLLAADVNVDGYADVLSVNATGVHQVYFGGSQGGLALQPEFLLSPGTATAALADFDGDEIPDLYLAGADAPSIDVLRNNGIGRFGLGDVTAPVIELIGAASLSVPAASPYTDPGATASDDVSGDLTAEIVVDNQVNTAIVGTYQVRYDVSDRAGNASSTVVRTVTVEATAGGGGGGGSIDAEWLAVFALLTILLRRRSPSAKKPACP